MKKELRTKLRSALSALSVQDLANKSNRAADLLFQLPEYQNAEIIMIYLSTKQEADTTPIVLNAWQQHKRVLAPQISWESKQMIPVQINDLDRDVADNHLGIREPIRGLPIPISLIDLVIVPGLGFDIYGNRLGRGRGFYDRFLGKETFKGIACGFALEMQVTDSIPAGPLDRKINMLATEEQVRRFDP